MRIRWVTDAQPYVAFSDLSEEVERATESARLRLPHVHDTWLARTDEQRTGNLAVGFVAQAVLESVFNDQAIPWVSYEATRIDDYRNDDPFDFILLPPGTGEGPLLTAWLREEIYPYVNSQGRLPRDRKALLISGVHEAGGVVCDLKSSVDNHRHGIAAIMADQHHIAYATQKNTSGFREVSGRQFLQEAGLSADEYIARKSNIKDYHFRVFFPDATCQAAFYVGFTSGYDLVTRGTVGPFPGSPWVLYHKLRIADGQPAGTEREHLFS